MTLSLSSLLSPCEIFLRTMLRTICYMRLMSPPSCAPTTTDATRRRFNASCLLKILVCRNCWVDFLEWSELEWPPSEESATLILLKEPNLALNTCLFTGECDSEFYFGFFPFFYESGGGNSSLSLSWLRRPTPRAPRCMKFWYLRCSIPAVECFLFLSFRWKTA